MASLIIVPRTIDGNAVDVASGKYLFGISNRNYTDIVEATYQSSNRFDGLIEGIYQYAIKDKITGQIVSTGSNIVKPFNSNCYHHYINNESLITIPRSIHGKDSISDIECYCIESGELEKVLPSISVIKANGDVYVELYPPTTGKIVVC